MSKTKLKVVEAEITINVSSEYLDNMKKQKRLLLIAQGSKLIPDELQSEIEGILGCFDEIQDKAVELGFDKKEVFDMPSYHPKGEDAHTEEFQKEVEKFDSKIIHNVKDLAKKNK